MANNNTNVDDLESWLDGLGSLREKLLQQGLKTKEELLWLSQEEIDAMCEENDIPLFEKKRLEMKLLALQALTKTAERTPSPNGSVSHKSNHHKRNKHSTKGGRDDIYTDDGSGSGSAGNILRHRTPTIVRIVFSEAEESKLNELDDKLIKIKDKIDQIMHNMSSLNWEKDRLDKRIDRQFDEFVLYLQQRRQDIKTELNNITSKQMNTMKKYIQILNKQTKQIKEAQKKCEKHLSNTKLSKNQRKSKVMKAANKALDNKNDEKIIVPEIVNKKKKDKKHKKKEHKSYFVSMQLEEYQVKRYMEHIGEVRRVMVPYPPKFDIFTIEANRIKLKVWDGNNKAAKKEKTEFIARIAEQVRRGSMSESPPNANVIIEEGSVLQRDVDNAPDMAQEDEKKENNFEAEDDENEEYKYNNNNNVNDHDSKEERLSVAVQKRERSKKRDKKKRANWDEYPVFKPHDINDRKVMSNKYTIWIDNLKANSTYLLKLRGFNKYGNGDWTKVYSFVTKVTAFEFKSSVIKQATMKNAVFEMLCKKLNKHKNNSEPNQFALKRIFSTETHGFSAKKFHEICDNKGRSLVIAESEHGNIFGGYSESSWTATKTDKWKNDENAFLFLLRNSKRQDVNLIFECIDRYNATRSNIKSGPCFGQGFDLLLCDNCNKSNHSYSSPKSYDIPSTLHIGGRKNFKIKNYDVYIVAKSKFVD